IPFAMQMAY
nr:Chain C, Spike protein S2 peptide [Severe acute respiratory syndrome coronavirus 2]